MCLVLEILVQGPGKSWNFLGYDVRGGHNDAGTDAKFAKISSDFICIYEQLAGGWAPPVPHSNCCLSLYLNIAGIRQGPGKMLLGFWKDL